MGRQYLNPTVLLVREARCPHRCFSGKLEFENRACLPYRMRVRHSKSVGNEPRLESTGSWMRG